MNSVEWIICERAIKWASALRTAIAREPLPHPSLRIYEVRKLREITARLDARPQSLVLVEVDRDRLAAVLEWFADAAPRYPAARFAALCEYDLTGSGADRQAAGESLVEAGVCEAAFSPRRLHAILSLGRRHAKLAGPPSLNLASLSMADWAWARLPWQGE